jgi:hypothetical protein
MLENPMTDVRRFHDGLERLLAAEDKLDNELLTGWIVVYETAASDDNAGVGYVFGPDEMTDWRALGLVDWARVGLLPEPEGGYE